MRPLQFLIREKITPQLAWSRYANHRGIGDGFPCGKRQCTCHDRCRPPILYRTCRQRKFEAEEEVTRHNRRTCNLPRHTRAGSLEVEQPHLGNIQRLRQGPQRDLLA